MILALHIHYSRAPDLVRPDYLMTQPAVPVTAYRDLFGNWCSRLVAPEGRFLLGTDALVNDSGLVDLVAPEAMQVPVEDLPEPQPIVVVDGLDREARREVGAEYRQRLLEVVDEVLGDRFVVDPSAKDKPDVYRDGLVLDAFDVTARCPRRFAGPSDDAYRDSVRNGRRARRAPARRKAQWTLGRRRAWSGPVAGVAVHVARGDPPAVRHGTPVHALRRRAARDG
jgi:hypothetical protein